MAASTRIYISDAFAFGGQPAVRDLLKAGYNTLIVWSIHVHEQGDLIWNDTTIVSNRVYKPGPFDLPNRLAQLRKAGAEIIFSVGAGEKYEYTNIRNLLGGKPGGPGNIIYDNFLVLKNEMVKAGGDIDAIDFDNEDIQDDSDVMINFGLTLAKAGYKHVTFCPSSYSTASWVAAWKGLASLGSQFVNAIHLQCYSGAGGNISRVPVWINDFKGVAIIPGLATNQAQPGPWWARDPSPPHPGESVHKVPNVAMFEGANWENFLYKQNFPTIDAALEAAKTAASFFFYCRGPLDFHDGRKFQTGDAVFFTGVPWWGSAQQCDAYYLGQPWTNIYNPYPMQNGCPADLQAQFKTWAGKVQGGFIWLYDSIISGLLAGGCGGQMDKPAATALAYRQAITNALG